MRKRLTVLCLVINISATFSQDIPVRFGKVTAEDFKISSALVDSNAAAVIIADVGTTSFTGNDKGWFSYIFKRRRRVKILNKKAFDLASVEIQLYQDEKNTEKLTDLTASTYNLDNGQVKEIKLDKKSLLEEKLDRNHLLKKFAMPSVVEGSILEYSYTVRSDFEFNMPPWKFQDYSYPTLWSEYNVSVPSLLSYRLQWQGYNSFFIDEAGDGKENYVIKRKTSVGSIGLNEKEEVFNISAATIKHRWVMKDLGPGVPRGFYHHA